MTSIEERIAMLSGRTSREAWGKLQRMRHHPHFGALLGYLEKLTGTIGDEEVDEAARRFLDEDVKQQGGQR
ncbi:MAG TPA: hypothetical protein VFP00_10555 [Burkholderiales bacterium]|nr:hypothetical protein [Burkholderiales bacterium]